MKQRAYPALPAWRLKCSDAEYYADPFRKPTLTYSVAKRLVLECPAVAWLHHPRLGGESMSATPAMRKGTLVDVLLFGGREVEVIDADDWRGKAAREARDAAEAAGKVACLRKEHEVAQATCESIRDGLKEFGLTMRGSKQFSVAWWETAADGQNVLCRGKLDNWDLSTLTIWDLKVRDQTRHSRLESHIAEMGYDIQGAAYTSAVSKLFPELAGRVRFVDVFVEPHPKRSIVTPVELTAGSMGALGRARWQRGVDLWSRCMSERRWPGYVTEIQRAEAPAWAMNELYAGDAA